MCNPGIDTYEILKLHYLSGTASVGINTVDTHAEL